MVSTIYSVNNIKILFYDAIIYRKIVILKIT